MRVLVTGGAGFIGSHLVDKLIKEGHDVYVVDDLSGGDKQNVNKKARFEQVDLRLTGDHGCRKSGCFGCRNSHKNIDYWMRIWKPEIVFHLACNAAENKAQFSPIDITSRNYSAFINTLTPFIKYGGKRFVFTSSIAVYGSLQTPFKETDKPEPEDLYGISKLAAEQTLKVMSQVHGFEYVVARPHNVYGPRQNMRDPYRNVVTIFMNKCLTGGDIPIYGDGKQVRCFSYIDDVIEALYRCGFEDVSEKTFNIGSDREFSLNLLAELILKQTATNNKITHLPDRSQEVKIAVASHKECKKYLVYKETAIEDGIAKTWEWAKTQGPQDPIYTPLELPDSDKIPANWRQK